ncbi:GatB/YqeY domain-containing protein [Labrys sp. LIt4]|uniref:GatB/YqeY domain-containing protein n=1 Tax=Labrys sp. LIt4 TaxID=2821355 RepID=UPI001AE04B05|nr:GatB/YqeY domain-containing protein [Labrys sp. LIt4]MBP0578558.1 GatB/YqeY domain-containing protein [Labrys sp. LIt4]
MSLRDDFTTAVKDAMKSGDKARLSVVRMIQAGLKDRDIAARGGEHDGKIPESEILSMLQKMIKQAEETLETALKAGREEMAAASKAEIEILSSFLPKQMDVAETKAAIAAVVGEIGAAGVKDMGKVMAVLKERFAGKMDFGKTSPLVKEALGG